MTAAQCLRDATQRLASSSDTPRLDAELLLAHALGVERESLLLNLRDIIVPGAFGALVERRALGEPLAYITGTRDFWTIRLSVGPGVLIPRPDSETLIEAATNCFPDRTAPLRVLDLGVGPGTLLLAVLAEWPQAHGLGVDISETALDYARRNASALGLDDRAVFRLGDWAEGLAGEFDLILANPPYVSTQEQLARDVAEHEPHGALFAGEDGLDDYRRIAPQLVGLLAPEGAACVEIGFDQGQSARALFEEQGLGCEVRQDLAGRDRCLLLRR